MNLSIPLLDVASGTRGALLQTIVRLERPVTRRQLAAAAGASSGHGNTVIADLISAGLIIEVKAGQSSLVTLNRDHLAAPSIIALAGLRGELIRRLRARLGEWPNLMGAWLFGSVARGDARSESDIDVLIVASDLESPELHQDLAQLQSDVKVWTGNDVQVVEHTTESWQALKAARNPLVEQIRSDGIALIPDDASLLERLR
jgi:predicted nucleotidyltransferase